LRAMNTIAAKQLRSGMARCRPPYGGRGGAGSKGSTTAHSWSGTRSSTRVAMRGACHIQPNGAKRRLKRLDSYQANQRSRNARAEGITRALAAHDPPCPRPGNRSP
jgi:hypothetical protein